MRLQVKLYADDGRRIWDNTYDVTAPLENVIKAVDEMVKSKIESKLSSNTQKMLERIQQRKVSTFQYRDGKTVLVERRVRN